MFAVPSDITNTQIKTKTDYIYIEAFKEQELRKFLQGIRGVSAWDTRLVPPDDSFNVLRQCMGQAGTTPHSHIKAVLADMLNI